MTSHCDGNAIATRAGAFDLDAGTGGCERDVLGGAFRQEIGVGIDVTCRHTSGGKTTAVTCEIFLHIDLSKISRILSCVYTSLLSQLLRMPSVHMFITVHVSMRGNKVSSEIPLKSFILCFPV
jgi:hypothetical protein